jgi:hypothetical protein
MELKDLTLNNLYITRGGVQFELIARAKSRDDEAVAEFITGRSGLSIISADDGPFRHVPRRLTAIVLMVERNDEFELRYFPNIVVARAYAGTLSQQSKIVAVSEVEILEGKFAEGWAA